jgi:hypothetical protein
LVWNSYCKDGQVADLISRQFDLSSKSILTIIHSLPLLTPNTPANSHLMLVMDCVYFGRGSCYLIVRDWYKRKNIYVKKLHKGYETIQDYLDAVYYIESLSNTVDGIVVDGRKGVLKALKENGHTVQMCQFHMKQIVRRYLKNNPQTQAGIDLKLIVSDLSCMKPLELKSQLDKWYLTYELFIKEKTFRPDGIHWSHTHKRVRSAYCSLVRNLQHLFVYQTTDNMPNTTNSADGYFAHLKDKVRIHRGLKRDRKHRLITYLIVRS